MTEIWKPVAGYVGFYEVSSIGRVRSLPRVTLGCRDGSTRMLKGKVISKKVLDSGYVQTTLCREGVCKAYRLHRIVLEAFVGPCPEGQEGCHNDHNRGNNVLKNLRWDTKSANQKDRIANGTAPRGANNGAAKLTAVSVIGIRRQIEDGKTLKALAAEYGVSLSTVDAVKARRTWNHI